MIFVYGIFRENTSSILRQGSAVSIFFSATPESFFSCDCRTLTRAQQKHLEFIHRRGWCLLLAIWEVHALRRTRLASHCNPHQEPKSLYCWNQHTGMDGGQVLHLPLWMYERETLDQKAQKSLPDILWSKRLETSMKASSESFIERERKSQSRICVNKEEQ